MFEPNALIKKAAFVSFLIFADQLIKYFVWISENISVCNTEIAFGIKIHKVFFYIIWLVIIITITFFYIRIVNINTVLSYGLILGGAISNMIDRFSRGCVIDFINLPFWPSFNLADFFITAGALILIYKKIKN